MRIISLEEFNIKKKFFICKRCKRPFSVRPENCKSDIFRGKDGKWRIGKEIICPRCLTSKDHPKIKIICQYCNSTFFTTRSKEALLDGWTCKNCKKFNRDD